MGQGIRGNSLPEIGRNGGYISRSKMINGQMQVREKINIAGNKNFFEKVKQIREATAPKHKVSLDGYDMITKELDGRIEIYDVSGLEILVVIPCNYNQAMELI